MRFHCCGLLYSDGSAYTGYRPRLYATLLELSGLGKASQSQGPMKGEEGRKKERKDLNKEIWKTNTMRARKNGQKLNQIAKTGKFIIFCTPYNLPFTILIVPH